MNKKVKKESLHLTAFEKIQRRYSLLLTKKIEDPEVLIEKFNTAIKVNDIQTLKAMLKEGHSLNVNKLPRENTDVLGLYTVPPNLSALMSASDEAFELLLKTGIRIIWLIKACCIAQE